MNDVYIVKHHHFESEIYLFIHSCFFFPVVFGKKFARRIGTRRVDPGAAGRNRMVGPIGSASGLAVKLQHRKKAWNSSRLHPGRLTWNLKMIVWKMIFLFNWVIFRFHVILPGCMKIIVATLGCLKYLT